MVALERIWNLPLWFWLGVLALCHTFDAASTHYMLQRGALEINPLMRAAYNVSPLFFFFTKGLFVLLGSIGIISGVRKPKLNHFANLAARVLALLMLAVVTYQAILLVFVVKVFNG